MWKNTELDLLKKKVRDLEIELGLWKPWPTYSEWLEKRSIITAIIYSLFDYDEKDYNFCKCLHERQNLCHVSSSGGMYVHSYEYQMNHYNKELSRLEKIKEKRIIKKEKKMKDKELTNKQVKRFWAKAPDLSKAKIKGSLIRKGDNPNPIISEEIKEEVNKLIPQKPLSKNSLLHKFI